MLNNITVLGRYPITHIQDFIAALDEKTVFSKIDLVYAYHHIPMAEEDIHKTVISTLFGLFEYIVMPCGLSNAA